MQKYKQNQMDYNTVILTASFKHICAQKEHCYSKVYDSPH